MVILSHGWELWPIGFFDRHWVIRPVMRSGNSAVTVFLVVAGFLTYRALSSRGGLEAMRPGVTLIRRVVRVGPSLWVMLVVLMLVAAIDPTDKTSFSDNLASVGHVLTYTWNWYVEGNLLTSRPDFGHLWYLSVDMQAFVIMSVLLYVMRRRPVGVLFVLAGFYLLLTWWRFHVTHTEFVFKVLVRTTARMDAFVLGVLLAAALPFIARLPITRQTWSRVTLASGVALVPLLWWCAANPLDDGDLQFLTFGGTFLQLDLAVLMAGLTLGPGSSVVTRLLERPRLVSAGRNSLLLYIWHFPIYLFVKRHSDGWVWPARVLVAAVLIAAICFIAHRVVERRISRLLRHPSWKQLDQGFVPYLSIVLRSRWRQVNGERESATRTRK